MLEKDKAVQLAKGTLENVWDGHLPVRPEKLVERIRMKFDDDGQKKTYPVKIRGQSDWIMTGASGEARFVTEGDKPHFLCTFNADEHPTRQRFTAAHELGHVMLGHVSKGKPAWRDMTFNAYNDINEVAANTYAAELLMPEKQIREYAKVTSSVTQLAETFGVSTSAITNRLKNLGIIDV